MFSSSSHRDGVAHVAQTATLSRDVPAQVLH